MNKAIEPKALVILLAIASLLTTLLVVLAVIRQNHAGAQPAAAATGQAPIFAEGIAVPEFLLTDQHGEDFGTNELAGKIWAAAFIFTRCPTVCPRLSVAMRQLQDQLAERSNIADTHLVSFTVDPEHDTPEVLSKYAARYGANGSRWRFLTGGKQVIWKLCKEGFKQPVGENQQQDPMPIFHSQKLVLVDRSGCIRGFYNVLEQKERDRILRDIERVAEAPSSDR